MSDTGTPDAVSAAATPVATAEAQATAPAAGALLIRRARPGEYTAIDELIGAAYAHDYGERGGSDDPMQRAETRDRAFDVWVASDDTGALLGSVTLRRAGGPALHEDIAEHELDLRLLGVAPTARRRGVGAALMEHSVAVAKAEGFATIALKTGPQMTGAHRLYESLGFVRAPERDGLWIGGERIFDLFTYVRSLGDDGTAPVR